MNCFCVLLASLVFECGPLPIFGVGWHSSRGWRGGFMKGGPNSLKPDLSFGVASNRGMWQPLYLTPTTHHVAVA